MNGLDVRIQCADLVLKQCRIHSVQILFGSIRCCINITNEAPYGGTFLVFKQLTETESEAALSGPIYVTLLSERRGNIGTGTSSEPVTLTPDMNSLRTSTPLTETFTMLSGADSEIPLVYETSGKPTIELGKAVVSIRLYALALVKECPHKCSSPHTEKESFMSLDDSAITEASDPCDEGSESDTSLENFLRNLRNQNLPGPVEKAAHSTQTPAGLMPKKRTAHLPLLRASREDRSSKTVIAVMAPNPYLRPSTEVDYYALTETIEPEIRDAAVSMSMQSDRGPPTRLHHPPVVYDAQSRRLARPLTAPTSTRPKKTVSQPVPQFPPRPPPPSRLRKLAAPKKVAERSKTASDSVAKPWH